MSDSPPVPPTPRRLVFGSVAEEYDALRPGYPGELVDDAIAFAGCRPGDEALEVGAGTGKATRLFAARGLRVTAVEPDEAMAAVASMRAATAGANVRIVASDFESAELPEDHYRLVFSAQAWHWVDPERRYGLARRALRTGGALAVIWNHVEWGQYAHRRELDEAYERSATEIGALGPGPMHPSHAHAFDVAPAWQGEIAAAEGLDGAELRNYSWTERHTTESYLRLLRTHSDHIMLPADQRERLLGEIGAMLDRLGGGIELPMAAVLCLARAR